MLQPYKLRFTGHGLFRDLTGKNTIPQWHVSGEKWRSYVFYLCTRKTDSDKNLTFMIITGILCIETCSGYLG